MGVKICKACKKPMKSTDTHCRTCGVEYKNSPIILIVIALFVLGGLFWVGYSFFSKENKPVSDVGEVEPKPIEVVPTNWVMEDHTDKMTDAKNFYLFNKAINAETGKSVDAGITIGCSYYGGLNGVFASDTPIKTESFSKDGAEGEYSVRFDDKPMESGNSSLSSLNRVFTLNDSHLQQVEDSSRVLIRITTGTDGYKTFEMNTSGGGELFAKMKEFCLSKAKENKTP
ncbi:hypothetical protein [Acinetobacter cumulans]|uniref:hypothetical protein n=1 Tax=Acinetobacter cumulans TaxID=2136182 RepID=UPI001443BFF2